MKKYITMKFKIKEGVIKILINISKVKRYFLT